jgi:hypothetical protein
VHVDDATLQGFEDVAHPRGRRQRLDGAVQQRAGARAHGAAQEGRRAWLLSHLLHVSSPRRPAAAAASDRLRQSAGELVGTRATLQWECTGVPRPDVHLGRRTARSRFVRSLFSIFGALLLFCLAAAMKNQFPWVLAVARVVARRL